jgi:hypothetical protein
MKNFELTVKGSFIALIIIVIILWLIGCVTPQKAIDTLEKNPTIKDVYISANCKPVDSTVYIKGETKTDTIETEGAVIYLTDTIWESDVITRIDTVRVKCPPNRIIKSERVDSTKSWQTDKIKINQLEKANYILEKERNEITFKSAKQRKLISTLWVILSLLALGALFIAYGKWKRLI